MEVTGLFGPSVVFADYTHTADELIGIINRKRINVLAGPPSLLKMIAEKSDVLAAPLKAIVSYAEVLDAPTSTLLAKKFCAPVIQIYQCSEGFIASTCPHGNLHINEDTILVEEEDIGRPSSEVRNVILTDLYRVTQPIIRYRLGDLLEFDTEPCPCGSSFRRIKVIHGRSDDIFHLRDAAGQIRYLFPDYVRRSINQASGDIIEYQALQYAPDDMEIRLIVQPGADRATIEKAVLDNLEWRARAVGALLGRVRFTATKPEPNPRSGKLIRVVRRF
jgi:putative adenylate-forming enzyme